MTCRWNNLRAGHVTVTGWEKEVAQVLKFIKTKCDVGEEFITFKKSFFR